MISVVFSSDDTYAQHAGVALTSVAMNVPDPSKLIFYILDCGITSKNVERLEACAGKVGSRIKVHKPDLKQFEGLPLGRYGVATWARLLAPELIPDEKVVYLDCDLIVEGDLTYLWNLELGERSVAAVANGSDRSQSDLGVESKDYFNAGVLVIDLEAWRKQSFSKKLLAYANSHRQVLEYLDQDTLNGCLRGEWLRLPPKWNAMPRVFAPDQAKRVIHETGYSLTEVEEARYYPAIIHYASQRRRKPWMYRSFHPLAYRYWFYLQYTPWAHYRAPDKNVISFFQRLKRRKQRVQQKEVREQILAVNPNLRAT